MKTIILDVYEDVISVIEKIKKIEGKLVKIKIPQGSVLFENSLNLKLIKKEAENLSKNIVFETQDSEGLVILDIIDEGNTGASGPVGVSEDFVSKEVSIKDVMGEKVEKKPTAFLKSFKLPKISLSLPKISFGNTSFVPVIVILLVLIGVGLGVYKVYWDLLKAEITIAVESQPLVESVQVRVGSNLEDNLKEGTLKGKVFAASTTETKSTKTTGSKVIGEEAKGKIEIINKTTVEKSFDSGERLYYESDDDKAYLLSNNVVVPPAEPQDPSDPASVLVPGKKQVDVVAWDKGSTYNLDSNSILEFEDYPTTSYIAEVVEDIEGGYLETLSVVTQQDLDSLSQSLLSQITEGEKDRVKNLVEEGYVYIENSQSNNKTKEEFSHLIDDETDEVSVTQSVIFKGLAYKEDRLEDLLEPKLKKSVPDEYELSSEEFEVNAQPLGNTSETVLSTTEADIQVTVKTYVLPEIKDSKVKDQLVGVSISQAKEILDDIPNVKDHSLGLNFNVPLINRLPNNPDNILIVIKRN